MFPSGVFNSIQRKLLALPNPLACLAVHSETDTKGEFPQRAYRNHPPFHKPSGDCLRSGTLLQGPQLNWGLKGPEFHFLDHSQNKVSGSKEIRAQPLATMFSTLAHLLFQAPYRYGALTLCSVLCERRARLEEGIDYASDWHVI